MITFDTRNPPVLNSVGAIAFETDDPEFNPQTGTYYVPFYTIYEAIPTTVTSPIPEPSSWILLGTGLLAAGGTLRKRLA